MCLQDLMQDLTLQDIKETKCYGQTFGWMDVKTVYPPTNTVCGGIKKFRGLASTVNKFLAWISDREMTPHPW